MIKLKKYIFILLSLLIITGCDNDDSNITDNSILSNTIEIDTKDASYLCIKDYKDELNNYALGSKYAIVTENDTVKTIRSIEIVESNKQSIINDFEGYINANYSRIKEYGGYTYSINHDNNKLITSVTINLDEFNMDGFLSEFPDFVNNLNEEHKLTYESLIKYYEENNIVCEEI